MSTTRVYSYYDDQSEFPLISQAASELGISVSQFQKYAVLLYVKKDPTSRSNILSMAALKTQMERSLATLKPGTQFIASSLFKPGTWANLSRGEKREISSALKRRIEADPAFRFAGQIQRGTLNRYEKI